VLVRRHPGRMGTQEAPISLRSPKTKLREPARKPEFESRCHLTTYGQNDCNVRERGALSATSEFS
jgi:hypothetical protein